MAIAAASLALTARAAAAQSSSADYLRTQVGIGDIVWVTAQDAPAMQGRVLAITPASLDLSMLGSTTPYAWRDIRLIERRDPIRNGLIIGGIIGGLAFANIPSQRTAGRVIGFGALGAAVGSLVVGYADFLREGREVIFRQSGR